MATIKEHVTSKNIYKVLESCKELGYVPTGEYRPPRQGDIAINQSNNLTKWDYDGYRDGNHIIMHMVDKEMTVAEISEALGYGVKVVK